MCRSRLGAVSLLLLSFLLPATSWTTSSAGPSCSRRSQTHPLQSTATSPSSLSSANNDTTNLIKPSFYDTKELNRRGKPIWKPRKQLQELRIGDPLSGYIVQEHLDGVTGPKVYLECGVGRYNHQKQTWKMVNAMLRLGRSDAKASVTKKRVARLRNKNSIECYVSRIHLENGQLEVVLKPSEVPLERPKLVSVSSLQPGQELVGTVQRIVPYGVFVDVGANRVGLLHIQKVANLYGSYIDKEKGLEGSGLEPGAKIKVQTESIEKKRLFLDFTADVKEVAAKEREEKEKRKNARLKEVSSDTTTTTTPPVMTGVNDVPSVGTMVDSDNPWAAYSEAYQDRDGSLEGVEDDEEGEYDEYDEDRDIEDALGLGTY